VARPRKVTSVDPNPKAYAIGAEPEAVNTELVIRNQVRQDENTIIWGLDDALPMHILTAIAESPTTTSCVGKLEMYTKGSGFSDEGLQDLVINKDGDTLWDLHTAICQYYVSLDGFTTNFKYTTGGKIANTYVLPTESCRLAADIESTEITGLKYNPYFGTRDYQQRFTVEYPLFDTSKIKGELNSKGTQYEGQAYFHGTKRTLYKHYPVPKFWAGKKWIYADAKMSTYIDKLLSNGFFQSALMKVIGDPNAMSRHPNSMKEVKGTDGVTRKEPTLTNGQVFDQMMAANFSGVEKAATIMTFWSLNKDQAIDIQSFPTTANFDLINGSLLNTIRMISLATEVPGILANLPDSQSPLSGQDAIPKAIDFMQSNTEFRRTQLEKFYNTILIPNLQNSTKSRVKIKLYAPTNVSITIDDRIWEVLTTSEKRQYVKDHTDYPINSDNPTVTNPTQDHISVPLVTDPAPVQTDQTGQTVTPDTPIIPDAPQVDEVLKGMKVSEIDKISSIIKRFNSGKLTLEQAKQFLAGYGLTEEQQTTWLNPTV
jgi:hypothetical protein